MHAAGCEAVRVPGNTGLAGICEKVNVHEKATALEDVSIAFTSNRQPPAAAVWQVFVGLCLVIGIMTVIAAQIREAM